MLSPLIKERYRLQVEILEAKRRIQEGIDVPDNKSLLCTREGILSIVDELISFREQPTCAISNNFVFSI